MPKNTAPFEFEKAVKELDKLVNEMESGELSLENSLKSFERGIGLIRECQAALLIAEQKVKILTENKLQDFKVEDDNS